MMGRREKLESDPRGEEPYMEAEAKALALAFGEGGAVLGKLKEVGGVRGVGGLSTRTMRSRREPALWRSRSITCCPLM